MKVSWIKCENDERSFRLPQVLGFDVFSLSEPEKVDEKIDELRAKEYNTIILSNEIAGFSEDIVKKYNRSEDIRIIIALDKDKI